MRSRLFVFVIISVCMALLLNYATDESVTLTTSTVAPEQNFDYFIGDIDSMQYDKEGLSQYRFQAKRSTHYPQPDHTVLEQPYFTLYQGEESPWHISAESGRIEKDVVLDQEKVELTGNVVIHLIDSEGVAIDIYTDFLLIYPSTKKVSTDREVLIKSPGVEMSATGMRADLNQELSIELLADFKGSYYE